MRETAGGSAAEYKSDQRAARRAMERFGSNVYDCHLSPQFSPPNLCVAE
jgi:hypothetical protein